MIKTTSPEDCKSILNVSRETIEKFKTILELLEKWQKKINLVGITGTNGKTSIVSLLYELFTNQGYGCGLLSTVKIQ